MPTDLFVRRALLWLKWSSAEARHDHLLAELRLPALPAALGDKTLDDVRSRHGAPDLQRRGTDLGRAGRGVPRSHGAVRPAARRDVPGVRPRRGLARGQLPGAGRGRTGTSRWTAARSASARRRGSSPRAIRPRSGLMCEGTPIPFASVRLVDDAGARGAAGHGRPPADPRRQRHARLFREPGGQRRGVHGGRLAAHRRSRARARRRALRHGPRRRKSSSSTARTTTRTTSRHVLQAEPGLELGKVVAAGARDAGLGRPTNSCCSCCIAAT